jgi:hypothetical protein
MGCRPPPPCILVCLPFCTKDYGALPHIRQGTPPPCRWCPPSCTKDFGAPSPAYVFEALSKVRKETRKVCTPVRSLFILERVFLEATLSARTRAGRQETWAGDDITGSKVRRLMLFLHLSA